MIAEIQNIITEKFHPEAKDFFLSIIEKIYDNEWGVGNDQLAVAIDFLTTSGANISGSKVKVIMKIKSKKGVDIDDISEWGVNRCSSNPLCNKKQEEVLLEEGMFKQIGQPKRILNPDGNYKIDADGTPWYEVELEELGTPLRTIN
jgi:hypothetical protein